MLVYWQSAPMIRMMQMTNFNLQRKINSSFIITLPIFKQCLAKAIMLKRQQIQANGLKQLDDKTNELLKRNAANDCTTICECNEKWLQQVLLKCKLLRTRIVQL